MKASPTTRMAGCGLPQSWQQPITSANERLWGAARTGTPRNSKKEALLASIQGATACFDTQTFKKLPAQMHKPHRRMSTPGHRAFVHRVAAPAHTAGAWLDALARAAVGALTAPQPPLARSVCRDFDDLRAWMQQLWRTRASNNDAKPPPHS